jgi:hypothetical protein
MKNSKTNDSNKLIYIDANQRVMRRVHFWNQNFNSYQLDNVNNQNALSYLKTCSGISSHFISSLFGMRKQMAAVRFFANINFCYKSLL